MQKIRCAHCSVINMEGFVTYPYCAGCGARLPEVVPSTSASGWVRPLGSALWTSIIGLGALVLVVSAARFLEPSAGGTRKLALYGRTPPSVHAGEIVSLQLGLDSGSNGFDTGGEPLREIKVRISSDLYSSFRLASLNPTPDKIEDMGGGRYYFYDSLPADTRLRINLLALRPGTFNFSGKIYAHNEFKDEFTADIRVKTALAKAAKPVSAR